MMRPGWDDVFMKITEDISLRSTCARIRTAAIIVRDQRIISIGYNGVVSGAKHCCDHWKDVYEKEKVTLMIRSCINDCSEGKRGRDWRHYDDFLGSELFRHMHHEWATKNELHGEQNAILHACKTGTSTDKATMYTIYSPCINCAKVIYTSGISEVVYKVPYARDLSGVDFLERNGVKVTRLFGS